MASQNMIFISFFSLSVAVSSCTTQPKVPWVFVEDFRSSGERDDEVIQQAIDEAGRSGTIYFEPNRTYVITNGIRVKESQVLMGNNATLKRATQTFSFLSQPCAASSDTLIVDSIPPGWSVGDQLQVFTDAFYYHSNAFGDYHKLPNIITRIDKNRIFLSSPVGASINGNITMWPKGTFVRKVYTLLKGDSIQFRSVPFSVLNMNFYGNKRENDLNYYWNVNATILVRGLGSRIENCRFSNIPNENIVGQGMYITNCQADDLNGSFVHLSGVDTVSRYLQKHSVIIGNFANRLCVMGNKVSGHAEAAFTTSYNGGFATIANNRIYNCTEAIYGIIDAAYDTADAGKSEVIITGNIFKNCAKIVYDFGKIPDKGKSPADFLISDNIFSHCGTNDWTTTHFKEYADFKIGDNSLTHGTVWKY
jgi:hypothetical protein